MGVVKGPSSPAAVGLSALSAAVVNLTARSLLLTEGEDVERGFPEDEEIEANMQGLTEEVLAISCPEPTAEQIELYLTVSWWLEGVAQTAIGCLGFVANAVATPILLSKDMKSIFNKLLSCLAIFDNIFIVCSLLEALRKHFVHSKFQEYLFGYFLYQFHNMILCCCIYITVVLALERYRAVWHPVEYHHLVNVGNPWKRVLFFVVPVVAFSVLFNLPKFFEVTFESVPVHETVSDEDGNIIYLVNTTETRLAPTKLKLDQNYVLWYSNVARLVVTGLVPFAALAYLNSRIYMVIKRRRRMTNRPRGAPSAAKKAEEARQAFVLLVIVILFLICNTLRIILNVHGLFNLKIIRESLQNGCSGITQMWTLVGASLSHVLLTLNSSVNFVIYCFMCHNFRRILYRNLNKLFEAVHIPVVLEMPSAAAGNVPSTLDDNAITLGGGGGDGRGGVGGTTDYGGLQHTELVGMDGSGSNSRTNSASEMQVLAPSGSTELNQSLQLREQPVENNNTQEYREESEEEEEDSALVIKASTPD